MPSPSPSAARRKALREADPVTIRVNPRLPVGPYLETARALRFSFSQAVAERSLDAAYVYGIRYATLMVEHMPKHPQYAKLHTAKMAHQIETVLQSLEQVTERMDAEELMKERELKQKKEQEAKEAEEKRRKAEAEAQRQREARQDTIQKSALAKLKELQKSTRDLNSRSQADAQEIRKTKSCEAVVAEQRIANPTHTTTAPNNDARPPPARSPSRRTLSAHDEPPLRSSEAAVIQTLQTMIQRHCDEHLPQLQEKMDQLRQSARTAYQAGDKRTALGRIVQRRRVQKQYTTMERAVFGMETQILLIQAAASDRESAAALRQAEAALADLKHPQRPLVDDVQEDWQELEHVNASLTEDLNPADEAELLSELQDDEDTLTAATISTLGTESVLQLPTVPSATKKSWFGRKKKAQQKEEEAAIVPSYV